MPKTVDAPTLKSWIRETRKGGAELAILDVREAGQFGIEHMLHAVPCPYSELEVRAPSLAPRQTVKMVLIDQGDGIAVKAARRLGVMGYRNISILKDGNPSWGASGFEVFQGVNVPSKAFGEVVEHQANTPRIPAEELNKMMERDANMVIVDGRTPVEHNRMSIPGGISLPNAEMPFRIHEIAPDPNTTIVVNCAGRARSIIGAQGLINAGVPNRVVALKAGTMGWTLAGFELEHDSKLTYPQTMTEKGLEMAARYTEVLLDRFAIPTVDPDMLAKWQVDQTRTLFLLDVRSETEYFAGHLPGSIHAPGGQLVQATDAWCGVWGARIVLVDTSPCARAAITAHWLRQMGWEVYVLEGFENGSENLMQVPPPVGKSDQETISYSDLSSSIESGSVYLVDVDLGMEYREGHLPGAVWCPRAQIGQLEIPEGLNVVVYSENEDRARLAALDLTEETTNPVAVLEGGRADWVRNGLPLESSSNTPPDSVCIDYLFWVSTRHMGSDEAARAYLEWEENLPAQIIADGDARFAVMTR